MKREEIEKMEAGPEMDALIAEKVIGIEHIAWNDETKCPECGGTMRYCGSRSWCSPCHEWRFSPYKEYSASIAAAWDVVEKMEEQDIDFHLSNVIPGSDAIVYECEFTKVGVIHYACEGSAPLAICRAALLAVMDLS